MLLIWAVASLLPSVSQATNLGVTPPSSSHFSHPPLPWRPFLLVTQTSQAYLWHLAQIGGEFEAGDMPTVVAHNDDGVDGIEPHMGDLVLLFGHHRLITDGLVLVDG